LLLDSDNTGYGIFETGIDKWDNWIENGKYLIAYDDSEFKKLERKTIKKALEILEANTHLKFVKYGDYTCTSDAHPCSWYMKFQRTKKGFSTAVGREKKSGPHFIQLLVGRSGQQNPMEEESNYFYVIHEV